MANVYGLIFQVDDKTKAGTRSISANLKKIESNADKAKRAMKGIGGAAGKAVGALGKIGVAATAAAAAFGFLAKRNLDALDALGKTATKLGVSTNFLSEYSLVANQAGLSTDQFNTGLQRFLRRLGQAQTGTGELVKPLERLGINMKDANGNFREGTDVFDEFITKLGQTTNTSQRLALAMGAFDTEGVAFINIAEMGAKEIGNLRREAELAGLSIDDKLTKAAADANDQIGLLLARARGFGLQFFGALAPAIGTLADDIKKALDEAVAGAGGMEAFANDLAARFVRSAAGFIDSLGMIFDGFTNSIAKATNIMQQLLVSLSNTGIFPNLNVSFSMEDMQKQLETLQSRRISLLEIIDAEGFDDKMAASIPILGRFYSDATQARNEVANIGKQITSLQERIDNFGQDGATIFTQMSTESSAAADGVADVVAALREQANELEKTAEVKRREAEIRAAFPYSEDADAITRLAAQQRVLAAATAAATASTQAQNEEAEINMNKFLSRNDVVKLAEERFIALNEELTKQQNEQRILNEVLDMAKDAYQNGGVAVSYYHDQLEQLGQTTRNYSDFSQDFYKRLRESVTDDNNRIKMLAEVNRKYEEGSYTLQQYELALRMLGETKTKTNTAVDDGIVSFEDYSKALEKSAINTVNEIKYLNRLKTSLDEAAASTDGLTAAQLEQLNTVNERLNSLKDEEAPAAFDVVEKLNSSMDAMIGTVSSTFADVILGLKDGFTSLEDLALSALRTIISTLIEAFIRSQILGQSIGGIGGGGGFFGSLLGSLGGLGASTLIPGFGILAGVGMLLGGAFANGGSTAGAGQKPILVGERGPEIFMPGKAGTVVSNEELNTVGDQGDLNVSFTINAIDTQTGVEFLLENKRVITGVIQEAYMRRGTSGPLG